MASPSLPDPLRGRTAPEQWVALPRELLARLSMFRSLAELKVVLYVLWHTYGYREYAGMKAITLDEFEHGRKRKDGSRMDEGTGLSRAAIKLGLKQAKEDAFLYEIVDDHDQARIVRWYAVQLPSDGSVRGIDANLLAQPYEPQAPANTSASGIGSSPLAQPYAVEMPPHGSVSGIDSSPQRARFQPSEGQILASGGIDASPRSEKETQERNPKKEPLESVVDATAVQDVDALQQRQVAKHALQKLLAEQESSFRRCCRVSAAGGPRRAACARSHGTSHASKTRPPSRHQPLALPNRRLPVRLNPPQRVDHRRCAFRNGATTQLNRCRTRECFG